MIYLLRAGDAVKIGYSETEAGVHRRVAALQTANPTRLTVLGVLPGDRTDEAELHRRFAHLHLSGEWFRAAPDLLGDLSMTSPEPTSAPETRPPLTFFDLNPTAPPPPRLSSSFRGLDLVLGGGFVPGTTVLLSGDPGAGKSTLLLQVAAYCACRGRPAAYVTAEEAAAQVQARAQRLGLARAPVALAATDDLPAILAHLPPNLDLLIVDSLQTYQVPSLAGARGGPVQTRAVLRALIDHAHQTNTIVVIVSHVNKANRAAGTNDLQHDVDVLLHLHALADRRVLRAKKNRFGPTDRTANFRMTQEGIRE